MAKTTFYNMASVRVFKLEVLTFSRQRIFVIVLICLSLQNFIKIWWYCSENGDLTIFKMTIVRHLEFSKFEFFLHSIVISLGFCVFVQYFAKIRQYCYRVMANIDVFQYDFPFAVLNLKVWAVVKSFYHRHYLIHCVKFRNNRIIFHWYADITIFSRPY